MDSYARSVLLAVLVVAVAAGTLAGPVAADENPENTTIDVELGVGNEANGGDGSMHCTGNYSMASQCDKEGDLSAGPAAVDYEGDNYMDPADRVGGGGDRFTFTVAGEQATVGFDCDFGPEPPTSNPCSFESP